MIVEARSELVKWLGQNLSAGSGTAIWAILTWTGLAVLCIAAGLSQATVCPPGGYCATDRALATPMEIGIVGSVWLLGVATIVALQLRNRRSVIEEQLSETRMTWIPRRRSARTWLAGSAVTVLLTMGLTQLLLLAPKVAHPECATMIQLAHGLGYPLNCDSHYFMELSRHPTEILQSRNPRQSRPVYVMVGAAISRTVGTTDLFKTIDSLYGESDTAYVPLILINFCVVVASVMLFIKVLTLAGVEQISLIIASSCLLVANEVVKAFFWTPHTQVFNILVPVLTVLVCWSAARRNHQVAWFAQVGAMLGVLVLTYGSAVIAVPAVLLVGLWRLRRLGWKTEWRANITNAAVLCVMFLIPSVCWIAVVSRFSGGYYSGEAGQYSEFVWTYQSLKHGLPTLWNTWMSYSVSGARVIWHVTLPVGALLALFLILHAAVNRQSLPMDIGHSDLVAASIATLACSLVFLDLLGIYVTRITFMLVPVLALLAALVASRIARASPRMWRPVPGGIYCLFSLVTTVQLLQTQGPYS